MSVYDAAHLLAKELKKSAEYDQYKKIEQKVMADEKNKEMIVGFRKQQIEVQRAQILGQEIDEETQKQIEGLQQILMLNPTISEFLACEMRLARMIMDVQKIIGEAVEIWNGMEEN